jgi:hypothetical protein
VVVVSGITIGSVVVVVVVVGIVVSIGVGIPVVVVRCAPDASRLGEPFEEQAAANRAKASSTRIPRSSACHSGNSTRQASRLHCDPWVSLS